MRIHTTKDGTKVKLRDMTDSHLAATIRLFERRAKEGVTVRMGGGSCAEDMWYDEDTLCRAVALERLGYADYVKERDRRISNNTTSELLDAARDVVASAEHIDGDAHRTLVCVDALTRLAAASNDQAHFSEVSDSERRIK